MLRIFYFLFMSVNVLYVTNMKPRMCWFCFSMCIYMLTHFLLNKMATISQTTFANVFSWMKILEFRLTFHWLLSPIGNKSALVQVMAWCLTGDKPLSEPMLPSSRMHICSTRRRLVKAHWSPVFLCGYKSTANKAQHLCTSRHMCRCMGKEFSQIKQT